MLATIQTVANRFVNGIEAKSWLGERALMVALLREPFELVTVIGRTGGNATSRDTGLESVSDRTIRDFAGEAPYKASPFLANAAIGTLHHFTATQHFGRIRIEADIDPVGKNGRISRE